MSDTSASPPPDPGTPPETPPTPDTGAGDEKDWKAEAEKWQTHARKHEERAKANATAAKELEELRKQSMTDQEKAVSAARDEGKSEGRLEGSARVVKAEIKAAAAGRLAPEQLAVLVDGLNLAVFLDESGEVDEEKVLAFVDGIAPKPEEPGFPDLGQGPRGTGGRSGDPLLAAAKAIAGVR